MSPDNIHVYIHINQFHVYNLLHKIIKKRFTCGAALKLACPKEVVASHSTWKTIMKIIRSSYVVESNVKLR